MSLDTESSSSSSVSYGSPGAAIRAARKRVGMSIEELASRTRLAKATLEAMENDAFDQLLEPVYVRGYYRKCARILELAEDPLIEAYEAMYVPPPKPAPPARLRLASGGDLGTSTRLPRRLVVLAPLAAIIISVGVWLWQDAAPPSGLAGNTVTLIDPISGEAVIADALPPIEAPAPAATNPTPAAAEGMPADAVAQSPATAPETPPAPSAEAVPVPVPETPAPPPAPVGTQLVLVFNAISWARVEDATGKSMLSGVIAAGERRELDGKPPYAVFLGNAPGVTVEYGGLAVDSTPFVKSNSTARFSVPLAGG